MIDKEHKAHTDIFSKLLSLFPSRDVRKNHDENKSNVEKIMLKLTLFIVDWNFAAVISSVLEKNKVCFYFSCMGRGTANSEILDLLGIGRSDKAVVLCLEQEHKIPVLLAEVRQRLDFRGPGGGIVFSIPLSGINSPLLRVFNQPDPSGEKTSGLSGIPEGRAERRWSGEDRRQSGKGYLIISVINSGNSDEFMNVAREAGAKGGTIINARGLAQEGAVKFFGISVQAEKEIILIISQKEKKDVIMACVCRIFGPQTKAEGQIFSLPVDNISGMS